MTFSTITMKELEKYMDEEQPIVIIDLRNKASYDICHLKGAINIPFQELERQADSLPRDKSLVFYCSRGGQSMLACKSLAQKGYFVVNVANGITFYQGKYLVRA